MTTLHEGDIALRDGQTVHVRPVRPGDRDAVEEFAGPDGTAAVDGRARLGTPLPAPPVASLRA
jgi:hypothetical protein